MEYPRYFDHKNNRIIFVYGGLGRNEYSTFYTNNGTGYNRVKSNNMPMIESKEQAQKNLDSYAVKNGFKMEGEAMGVDNFKKGILAGLEEMQDINSGKVNTFNENIVLKAVKSIEIKTFDYSIVDIDTAAFLHQKEQKITQIHMMSVMAIGRELKEAHDKLSNHYQGCFGKWCESIGMSRDAAENYIRAYKYVAENFGNIEEADQIQPSLLFAISRPSAPEELQKAVLNGDITTHKQYKELEAKLKEAKSEAEAKQQSYDRLEKKSQEHYEKVKRLEEELKETKEQLLEAQTSENNIATAVVEKAPDEVLEELEELREANTAIEVNAELKILLKALNNNILSLGKVLSDIKENSSIAAECIPYIEQVRENMILIKKISLEKFDRDLFDFIKD